ncbi:hypothetical protein [Streptomyces canus]|uniref:hypothetical protein n=1 Tax=Streptomyces canus TaxID=58343 RepID=UPI0037220273
MRMNETFATTVAGVAPVILLVAVVEIANRMDAFRTVYIRMGQQQKMIDDLYASEQPPTGPQLETVAAATGRSTRTMLAELYSVIYVASATFVGVLLLVAEALVLRWLAVPHGGSNPRQAAFCLATLLIGFGWVVLMPLLSLVVPVADNMVVFVKGFRRHNQFFRELAVYRKESQATDEPSS